jgi:DNA polymerase I-like protein with 3'-5' exonuclease and polymerase domains
LQPNLNIHDDLTFIWPTKKIEHYARIVVDDMLMTAKAKGFEFINVPLMVEMAIGQDWASMEEVAKYRSDEWFARSGS